MTTGSLSYWKTRDHHGLIASDDDGSDIYLHAYDLRRSSIDKATLSLGMRLAFTTVDGGGRHPRATAIKILQSS